MQGHKCTLAIPTNLYALVFYTDHTCHGRSCRIVSCIGIHLSPVCTQRKDNCVYTTIGKTLMSGFLQHSIEFLLVQEQVSMECIKRMTLHLICVFGE